MIKLVNIKAQYDELKNELDAAVLNVVKNSAFIGGTNLDTFEEAFADFTKARFATGVSNGTSALEIALKGNNIGNGDKVITVANTFFATAEAIINVGAIPIFIDVNMSDALMNTSLIESQINRKTKAIIPVHLFGHLVNMKKIHEVASKYSLVVIEDAAQAHGAVAEWGTPGKFSAAAAYSFYPGKNLGAWGDAGAITTNDDGLKRIYNKLRDHGRLSKYEHDLVGTNARMDSLQAAILEVKLKKIPSWNERRTAIARRYIKSLSSARFKILVEEHSYNSAWHLFVVRVKNRENVQSYLASLNIETGIHYPIPLHKQPALEKSYKKLKLPNTELLAKEMISLPIHPHLSDDEVDYIIREFLKVAEFTE